MGEWEVENWERNAGVAGRVWLGILDSNQGYLIQSQASYR